MKQKNNLVKNACQTLITKVEFKPRGLKTLRLRSVPVVGTITIHDLPRFAFIRNLQAETISGQICILHCFM